MKLPESFTKIPCNGKIPCVAWKDYIERKPTQEEKTSWDLLYPNGGIGIVTGKLSNVLVLDDDGGLYLKGYSIPQTWTVKTPRGGTHYYFRWTPELDTKVTTQTGLMEKVDVRGEGGFAAFYGFEKAYYPYPMALPPQWLIDLLPNKELVASSIKNDTSEDSLIIQSLEQIVAKDSIKGRNPTFLSVIGKLKKKGLLAAEIEAFLKPWAEKHDYLVKIHALIEDQFKRYPQQLESKSVNDEDTNISDFLANVTPVKWIIPGMVAESSIVMVGGLGGSYKTWIVNDLAIALASGGLWLDKFQCPTSKVVMINQERAKSEVQRRFLALLKAKNINKDFLRNNLLIKNNSTIRINLQNSFDAFRRYLIEDNPKVVLVDSFQTFHSLGEESRADMQFVFEKLKLLRDEFGVTFIFIDHENKMAFKNNRRGDNEETVVSHDKLAGSAVKSEAPEAIYIVRKDSEDGSMVYLTKGNNGESCSPFLVKVENLNEEKTSIQVKAY